MKTLISAFAVLLIVFVLFVRGTRDDKYHSARSVKQVTVEYPVHIKTIVDNKCYGCHSPESKSDEAMEKLMWDSIPLYSKAKLIGKLDNIIKVLDAGEMPPKKVIETHPEAAISAEDSKTLKEWAEKTAEGLLN
jgi:hypothetical protein